MFLNLQPNLPFEKVGTDPELKAGDLLRERREAERASDYRSCSSHVRCCCNTACPTSSQKSLYIQHSVRIQPDKEVFNSFRNHSAVRLYQLL